jgi:hypothetical protein
LLLGDAASPTAWNAPSQPLAAPTVPTAAVQDRPAENIRIDLFGIEDALTDIVDEVLGAHSEADPWDAVLDELLA